MGAEYEIGYVAATEHYGIFNVQVLRKVGGNRIGECLYVQPVRGGATQVIDRPNARAGLLVVLEFRRIAPLFLSRYEELPLTVRAAVKGGTLDGEHLLHPFGKGPPWSRLHTFSKLAPSL